MSDFSIPYVKSELAKLGLSRNLGYLVEECAELIVSSSHLTRGRTNIEDLASEVADVLLMADVVRFCIGPDIVDRILEAKAKRCFGLLESGGING